MVGTDTNMNIPWHHRSVQASVITAVTRHDPPSSYSSCSPNPSRCPVLVGLALQGVQQFRLVPAEERVLVDPHAPLLRGTDQATDES